VNFTFRLCAALTTAAFSDRGSPTVERYVPHASPGAGYAPGVEREAAGSARRGRAQVLLHPHPLRVASGALLPAEHATRSPVRAAPSMPYRPLLRVRRPRRRADGAPPPVQQPARLGVSNSEEASRGSGRVHDWVMSSPPAG
jgi:hypothetical protein